jgi:ribose transport system permease protein
MEPMADPAAAPLPAQAAEARRLSAWHRFVRWDLSSVATALLVICGVLSVAMPAFHSAYNLKALAFTVSVTGIVALAQLCALSIGQLNLTLTAVGAGAGIFAGFLMQVAGVPFPLAVLAGLLLGIGAGGLQGLIIVWLGLNPFIVSLALAATYLGAMLGLTKGASFNRLPPLFVGLGRATLLGAPVLPLITLVIAALVALLFHRTATGRRLLATGASPRAARMSAVPTGAIVLFAHVASGFLAALAGLMLVTRLASAQPSLGSEWLLPSFAAPVLGGTLLTGGKVRVLGTILGAVLLAVIANGLVLLGVSAYWYQSLLGVVLLAALALDKGRQSYVLRNQL